MSFDEYTRIVAAEILGKIDPGNEIAIAALVKVIASATDEYTRRRAAEILGKIGLGNEIAIAALVKLIASTTDEFTRRQAAEILGKILSKSLMPKVVNALKNSRTEKAVEILWNCAQNLSYPEFYSAWHKSRSC